MNWSYENASYGHDDKQKLDIIIPNVENVHAIVYIHGGAYLFGSKREYPSFLIDYSKHNVFATINYRIINEENTIQMTDILSDVENALLKIIELSKKNNVNIKDFILIGHSAGGHIGLLFGYKNQNEKIKTASCISLAGPADFTDDLGWSSMPMWGDDMETRLSFLSRVGSRLTGKTIELKQRNWTLQKNYSEFAKDIMEISPISYINKNKKIPPTLLVHARLDDQVPYSNAIRIKSALDKASITNKLITTFGNADSHMLGGEVYSENSPIIFDNQSWVTEAKKWIETYLI